MIKDLSYSCRINQDHEQPNLTGLNASNTLKNNLDRDEDEKQDETVTSDIQVREPYELVIKEVILRHITQVI